MFFGGMGPHSNFFAIWSTSMRFGGVLDMVGGLLFFFACCRNFCPPDPRKCPLKKILDQIFHFFWRSKNLFSKNEDYGGLSGQNTPNGLLMCFKHLQKVQNTFSAIFERKQKNFFSHFCHVFLTSHNKLSQCVST